MHRLVYISDAVREIDDAELARIAAAAKRTSDRFGITGLLLYHKGRFFHELEGPRAQVAMAFDRIRRDPCHTNIEIVDFGPAKGRAFERWTMGADRPESLPDAVRNAAFSIFDLIPADAPQRGSRPKVRAQVRNFLAGFDKFVADA